MTSICVTESVGISLFIFGFLGGLLAIMLVWWITLRWGDREVVE